jgi:hypothetical protein
MRAIHMLLLEQRKYAEILGYLGWQPGVYAAALCTDNRHHS